jgi:hypothetical protein
MNDPFSLCTYGAAHRNMSAQKIKPQAIMERGGEGLKTEKKIT